MSKTSTIVNDQELERRLLEVDGYLAVAFLAFDSYPCGCFVGEFEKVAEEFLGVCDREARGVSFLRIEATENPTITEQAKVTAVPTTVLYLDGREVKRYEGPYSSEALTERLREIIGKAK